MTSTVDTTGRVLRLLGVLGTRPVWTGPELAERLGVTTRTVRRDIERLRELGYPVLGERGADGGYQLGAGGRMPPLLLDDDEAVAVAVCLRLAAGTSVSGVAEAALRTLAKLDPVLPSALRERIAAIDAATVTPTGAGGVGAVVDADVLLGLAQAVRRTVRVRFSYVARDGSASEREVEPYRLVVSGHRWYLLAWDLGRTDWRTLRLDRMTDLHVSTFGFRPRPTPDPGEFVQQSVTRAGYRYTAVAWFAATPDQVSAVLPANVATVQADPGGGTQLTAGADRWDELAWYLVRASLMLGCELRALEPPEFLGAVAELAARVSRAAQPS